MSHGPQSFTYRADRIITVLATPAKVSEAFDPNGKDGKTPPPLVEVQAIWDTGATGSVINQAIVDACGLKPIGMTKVLGVSGEDICDVFMVNIVTRNNVMFPHVRVTKGKIGPEPPPGQSAKLIMLIGMDIISRGDFAVTNQGGKTVFSFRVPSLEAIDFVAAKPVVTPGKVVGRNSLCPCGSGRKYKQCHGKVA